MSQPDWACDLATKNPEKHLVDTQGAPEDPDDFASKAVLYCNKYGNCYGGTGDCINAVTPERLKNRVIQHTTSKKEKNKKKSHKKHRRHGGKRSRRKKRKSKRRKSRRKKRTKKRRRRRKKR
jgi:hypothetical protein